MPITTVGVWANEDYAVISDQLREAIVVAQAAGKTVGNRSFEEDTPQENQVTIIRQWNSRSDADDWIELSNSLEVKPISYVILADE